MTGGLDLDDDLVAEILVGADVGKGGIAAQHLAATRIHHAAADRVAQLKPDGVKAPEQTDVPGKAAVFSIRCLG
jgi:hypothetical protein